MDKLGGDLLLALELRPEWRHMRRGADGAFRVEETLPLSMMYTLHKSGAPLEMVFGMSALNQNPPLVVLNNRGQTRNPYESTTQFSLAPLLRSTLHMRALHM